MKLKSVIAGLFAVVLSALAVLTAFADTVETYNGDVIECDDVRLIAEDYEDSTEVHLNQWGSGTFDLRGSVVGWNPKFNATVRLRNLLTNDIVCEQEFVPAVVYNDGRVCCDYEFTDVLEGMYAIEMSKQCHLTYSHNIAVMGLNDVSIKPVHLICGDINGDEKIKLNDRTYLLGCMNTQRHTQYCGEQLICDLNGDGRTNMADMNILRVFFNTDYRYYNPFG